MRQAFDKSLLLRLYGILIAFEVFQLITTNNILLSLIITIVCHVVLGVFVLLKIVKKELSEKQLIVYFAIIGGIYYVFHSILLICQISNKLVGFCLVVVYYLMFIFYVLIKKRTKQKATSEAYDKTLSMVAPVFFVIVGAIGVFSPIKEYFVSPVIGNGLLLLISSLYTARFWYGPIR